jgi:hypothetical protein
LVRQTLLNREKERISREIDIEVACLWHWLTIQQCSTKDMFIRGSVVRYVHLPSGAVDTALLEDATRRETEAAKNKAK